MKTISRFVQSEPGVIIRLEYDLSKSKFVKNEWPFSEFLPYENTQASRFEAIIFALKSAVFEQSKHERIAVEYSNQVKTLERLLGDSPNR